MADLKKNVKNIWMKGMQAIGNTASNIASNTKFKVDEMNLLNRRREILSDFGAKAYALWQKGAIFPEELEKQLIELSSLDEKLNDLRAEKISGFGGEGSVEEEYPMKESFPADENVTLCDSETLEMSEEVPEVDDKTEEKILEMHEGNKDHVEKLTADNVTKEIEPPHPAIRELFDEESSVQDMANKMNQSLNQMRTHTQS